MKRLSRKHFKAVLNKLLVLGKGSPFENAVSAIALIVKQGVPYVFHVRPDLVRASRL